LHLYGKTSNGAWRQFFRWVFEAQGVYRLVIRTNKRNREVKKAAPKFGFKFEGVERDYYGCGDDALRFYMTPPACRWLQHEDDHGQLVQKS
jgi:RimJ/RimL family protein N-acetyltransferase